MQQSLQISIGQHSDKGRKDSNQDFHGALIPEQPALGQKGIAIALADGISTSKVSRIAAESAIKSFLSDYYCTSEAWTVKTSGMRVISAINSWLHSQSRRSEHAYNMDKGYVCTFSAIVIKARSVHLFHIGDSRIYRLAGNSLEQLTEDHRVHISSQENYLGRALGMKPDVEIENKTLTVEKGDVFILATDGIYDHVEQGFIAKTINANGSDLDQAAKLISQEAFQQGSKDNLTLQIVRIDNLAGRDASEVFDQAIKLPVPPLPEANTIFDGFKIIRQLHGNSRSHIYLAEDIESGWLVALKLPSIDLREDPDYLQRFMMEEWIARRISSTHVLKAYTRSRKRNYLYVVTEYIEGQTLSQWMIDNPKPDLETVRDIAEQITKGLRAFHRMEMLHQDLRPGNIMIDSTGTVKIIDFGSTRVAGVLESAPETNKDDILGTLQYTAPEYFAGEAGTTRSDMFSLGVIVYQMLTGILPYGTQVSKIRNRTQQMKLRYKPINETLPNIPEWVDCAIAKAIHPDPFKRYEALSEIIHDLRNPNKRFVTKRDVPLSERNPVLFWKGVSFVLALVVVVLLVVK